jgi:hypothetical protein
MWPFYNTGKKGAQGGMAKEKVRRKKEKAGGKRKAEGKKHAAPRLE